MADEKLQPLGTVTPTKKKEEPELSPIQNKSVDKYQIRDIPTMKQENANLVKDISSDKYSTPAEIALQRKMNRRDVASARDTNLVVDSANRLGVNLNEDYSYPVTDPERQRIAKDISTLVADEKNENAFLTYAGTHPNPNYVTPPTINVEEEKRKARRERAAKWADALYAFGEGMQGRTANKDNMASTIMQRKRDELFQNYKNTSEANKQTAKNWEYNYRKDLMDWIGKQQESDRLSDAERQKYKFMYDKLAADQDQAKEELGLQERKRKDDFSLGNKRLGIEREKIDPTVARGKYGINQREYDYDLKASDIPNLSSKAKADTAFLEEHPEFFIEYKIGDSIIDGVKTPVTERKLNISDIDLALAYKNRLANKRVVPYSQIPLSPEGYESQRKYEELKGNTSQNQQPANNQKPSMFQ